jgi:hypothetical protein
MSFVTYVRSLIKSKRAANMRKINAHNILVKMPREEATLESYAQMGNNVKIYLTEPAQHMLAQWWTFIKHGDEPMGFH